MKYGKTCIFIDGTNLYHTAKDLNMKVDFARLKKYFENKSHRSVRALYYTAVKHDPHGKDFLTQLLDWLEYNGFTVVTKPVKVFSNGEIKGNMDIEICVDVMNMCTHFDNIVLFTGDGDFTALVRDVQRKGATVTICSSRSTNPQKVADELLRQADEFIELDKLRDRIEKQENGEQKQNE